MPTGVVLTEANVREGRFVSDPRSPLSPLPQGGTVEVTGYAADPNNDEFSYRYQISLGGQTLWTSGLLVELDPDDEAALPYIPLTPDDPAKELRDGLGVRLNSGETVTMDSVNRLAPFLSIDIALKGNWTAEQVSDAAEMLETLRAYGAYIRSEGSRDSAGWSITELRAVYEAVRGMARGARRFLRNALGDRLPAVVEAARNAARDDENDGSTPDGVPSPVAAPDHPDEAVAFRLLYAPLRITRSPKDNLSPNPANGVWFAKNSNGYEIQLGNRVFFKGRQTSRSNPDLPYDAVQLIAHEIAHVINWRYGLEDDGQRRHNPDQFYKDTMQEVTHRMSDGTTVQLVLNSGYGFAARSSNEIYETVTDAIANISLNVPPPARGDATLAARQADARRQQVNDLMRRVVLLHLREYGGVAALRQTLQNKGLAAVMRPCLGVISRDAHADGLDTQVAALRTLLGIV